MDASVGFAVLAHRNPHQVARLADSVGPERVALHVDARLSAARAEEFYDLAGPVRRAERARSEWASWGVVEATLSTFRALLADRSVTHIAVISGQDYLLVSVHTLEAALTPGFSRVSAFGLPSMLWGRDGGMTRFTRYNYPVMGHRVRVPVPRQIPDGYRLTAGSPWAIYSREHAAALLEHAAHHGQWWRRVWIPDESFIPTMLSTFHAGEFDRSNPGYQEWAPGSAHPRTFTTADVPRVVELAAREDLPPNLGRKYFARKFDDEPGQVLDALRAAAGI